MEETLIKRSMPNSLDAEQSVIGSMIMDKDAILTAMEMLTSDDFYHKQYGILFDAMIELYSKGLPVDLITEQIKRKRGAGGNLKSFLCERTFGCGSDFCKY